MAGEYYIGCDVGTGSARAGVFDRSGEMISMATHDIKMWCPETDFEEQSSEDIWNACCSCIQEATKNIDSSNINGIGFDATCSLVVLGKNNQPISVSPSEKDQQNVIVWMDHRAIGEAEKINKTDHKVLKFVGGTISPEMETPKLLWLKKNKPETWKKATKFFDLSDFLVYKSTGKDIRSVCTTTCKWTYLAHEASNGQESPGKWDDSFFNEVGLGDLVEEKYDRIGKNIKPVGQRVADGLSKQAAEQMDLAPSTPVSVGIIDAHAGGLGLLGMDANSEKDKGHLDLESRIALIGGTSSCHMAVSSEPNYIDGVWGPYYSAMVPDMWLTEGGQSATGALIDHVIYSSKQSFKLEEKAEEQNKTVYDILNTRVYELAEENGVSDVGELTADLHVLPYFHGNRSPRANTLLLGSICGLKLSSTIDDLALLYLATIQAIAYGTRHIIESLNDSGYTINKIMATGGGTKNELFLKEHADICQCQIVLPKEKEAVLLGSAVLGAVAGGTYSSVIEGMQNMNNTGQIIYPVQDTSSYHQAKYDVFHKMYRDEMSYFEMMGKFLNTVKDLLL